MKCPDCGNILVRLIPEEAGVIEYYCNECEEYIHYTSLKETRGK